MLPEWRRITEHAALVYSIDFSGNVFHQQKPTPPALVSLMEVFKASFPDHTLFPKLKSLKDPPSFPALSALLVPSIEILLLSMRFELPWDVIAEDVGRMSGLSALVLHDHPLSGFRYSLTPDIMHTMVSQKTRLKFLALRFPASWEHVKLLQNTPELTTTILTLGPTLIPYTTSTAPPTLFLHHLSKLILAGNAEACALVIQELAAPLLSVNILLTPFATHNSFATLVSSIAQISHLSLTSLDVLTVQGEDRTAITEYYLSGILVSLARMRELETLELGVGTPIQVTTSDFTDLVKGPSKLKKLGINMDQVYLPWFIPQLAPISLLALGAQASQIRDLSIYMNDEWQHLINHHDIPLYPNLRSLNVGFSKITTHNSEYTIAGVAKALSKLFPNLKSVECSSKFQVNRELWRDVSRGLTRMAKREQTSDEEFWSCWNDWR